MIAQVIVGVSDRDVEAHPSEDFGFVARAEVYDLLPQPGNSRSVLRLCDSHEMDLADASKAHSALGLPAEQAGTIMRDVLRISDRWRDYMRTRNVSDRDISRLERAFIAHGTGWFDFP